MVKLFKSLVSWSKSEDFSSAWADGSSIRSIEYDRSALDVCGNSITSDKDVTGISVVYALLTGAIFVNVLWI